MICPSCSVAEIAGDANRCFLCGYSPNGAAVTIDRVAPEEMQEIIQKLLARRFGIEQLIGRGRVSYVYSAREVGSGKEVALKIIPLSGQLDADLVWRFEREASRAASLHHSHIVPIFASGASGTLLWYSMERVSGRSLAQLLRDGGRMDLDTCLRILDQVASALDYAHRRGVIHGNLNSTNIVVDDDGWVRVTDFSIMRAFIRGGPSGHHVLRVCTPEYMAPEQFSLRGETASADQYAMGVIAFESLSGTLPFVGDSYEEVARLHQCKMPARLTELREDVPILIADAIEQALLKQPTARFATVMDFFTVLRGVPPQGAKPMGAKPTTPRQEPRAAQQVLTIDAPRRRIPLLHLFGVPAVALAVLVILLAIAGEEGAGSAVMDESQSVQQGDGAGNPVSQAEVNVPAATNGSGVAITGTAGNRTLESTSGTPTPAPAQPINSTAGAASPDQALITADPNWAPADGATTSTITVQLRDASGNSLLQGGDTVVLFTDLGILSAVNDNGDGTYTATIASLTPRTATIAGGLNGAPIADDATVTFTKP